MTTKGKVISWITAILLIALAAFIFIKFCFVYKDGYNEGEINYFQKEGFVFKTYEGKLIQAGFNSKTTSGGGVQSNELKFSVADDNVARQIEESSNCRMKLHWKYYLGTLPWRGNSQYIVDSVIVVSGHSTSTELLPQ